MLHVPLNYEMYVYTMKLKIPYLELLFVNMIALVLHSYIQDLAFKDFKPELGRSVYGLLLLYYIAFFSFLSGIC